MGVAVAPQQRERSLHENPITSKVRDSRERPQTWSWRWQNCSAWVPKSENLSKNRSGRELPGLAQGLRDVAQKLQDHVRELRARPYNSRPRHGGAPELGPGDPARKPTPYIRKLTGCSPFSIFHPVVDWTPNRSLDPSGPNARSTATPGLRRLRSALTRLPRQKPRSCRKRRIVYSF